MVACTLALFVSGVVLQRQSVKNLNAVLHPTGGRKGPWEKLVQKAELALDVNDPGKYQLEDLEAVIRGGKLENEAAGGEGSQRDAKLGVPTEPDWSRRAYVQMVSTVDDICNAVMGVTSLSIQGSKAKRLLIYPSAWDDADTGAFSSELELITIAKREHMLETLTTAQLAYDGGDVTDALLNQDFDKLLYLEPRGLIINATRLDEIFETKMTQEVASMGSAATLLQPRQSSLRKYEDLFGDTEGADAFGLVETAENVEESRGLKHAYTQGQLLGDIGYLQLRRSATQHKSEQIVSSHEELRKRDEYMTGDLGTSSLDGLVMEKYNADQETICGQRFQKDPDVLDMLGSNLD